MKQAGHKNRRHRVLSSAWELKEIEHYSRLMSHIHWANHTKYKEFSAAMADGRDLLLKEEESAVQGMEEAETIVAMNHKLYNECLASVSTADKQLDQLEEALKKGSASFEEDNASSDVSSDEGSDG